MSTDCDSFYDAYGCVFTSCRSYTCPFPLVRLGDATAATAGGEMTTCDVHGVVQLPAIALARQGGRLAPMPRLLQLCLPPPSPTASAVSSSSLSCSDATHVYSNGCTSFAQLLSPRVRPLPLDRDALFFGKLQCVGDVCAVVSRSTAGQQIASYYRVMHSSPSHDDDDDDDKKKAAHTRVYGEATAASAAPPQPPAAHVERAVLRHVMSTALVGRCGQARSLWALHTHTHASSSSPTMSMQPDTLPASSDGGVTGVVRMDVESLFAGDARPLWSLHSSQLGCDGDVVALPRSNNNNSSNSSSTAALTSSSNSSSGSNTCATAALDGGSCDDDGCCAVVFNSAGVLRVDARQPPAATFDIPCGACPLRSGGVAAMRYYVTVDEDRVVRVLDARRLPQPLLQLSCPQHMHVRAQATRDVVLLLSATQVGILDAPLGAVVAAQSFGDGVVLDATLLPPPHHRRCSHHPATAAAATAAMTNDEYADTQPARDRSGDETTQSSDAVTYCVSTSNSLLYDVTVTY